MNRRDFMKFLGFGAAASVAVPAVEQVADGNVTPNVDLSSVDGVVEYDGPVMSPYPWKYHSAPTKISSEDVEHYFSEYSGFVYRVKVEKHIENHSQTVSHQRINPLACPYPTAATDAGQDETMGALTRIIRTFGATFNSSHV